MNGFLLDTNILSELTMVSRDEAGFRNTGVGIINPFSKPKPAGN